MRNKIFISGILLSMLAGFNGCKKRVSGVSEPVEKSSQDAVVDQETQQKKQIADLGKKIDELNDALVKSDASNAKILNDEIEVQRDDLQKQINSLTDVHRQELENLEERLVKMIIDNLAKLSEDLEAGLKTLELKQFDTNKSLAILTTKVDSFKDIYATKQELSDAVIDILNEISLSEQFLVNLMSENDADIMSYVDSKLLSLKSDLQGELVLIGQNVQQVDQKVNSLETELKGDLLNLESRVYSDISDLSSSINSLNNTLSSHIADYNSQMGSMSVKLDQSYSMAKEGLTKLVELRLDGQDLVNEVGSLITTISNSSTTDPSQQTQLQANSSAEMMNLLLTGFTKEAAGLIIYAQEIEDALKNRYDALLSLYQSLDGRLGSLESSFDVHVQQNEQEKLANDQAIADIFGNMASLEADLVQTELELTTVKNDSVVQKTDLTQQIQDLSTLLSQLSIQMQEQHPAL